MAAAPRRASRRSPTAAKPARRPRPAAAAPAPVRAAEIDERALRCAAQARALDAIETLAALMHAAEKEQTRLAAALAILDRAFGRTARESASAGAGERGPVALVPIDTGIARAPNEAAAPLAEQAPAAERPEPRFMSSKAAD